MTPRNANLQDATFYSGRGKSGSKALRNCEQMETRPRFSKTKALRSWNPAEPSPSVAKTKALQSWNQVEPSWNQALLL